jgi:hypothetical protein
MAYYTNNKSKRSNDKRALWPVWALCGMLLLVLAASITGMFWLERPRTSDIAAVDVVAASDIRLGSSEFPQGQLRLFRISDNSILLAAERLTDRRVHVALSGCKACSRQGHKSYSHQNELMCGTCNHAMRFENDVSTAKQASSRCPLPEVPVTEHAGAVVISASDVQRVAEQFSTK